MNPYSSAWEQHGVFFCLYVLYIWKLSEDWDSPCKPLSRSLTSLLPTQTCWAHAALKVSVQYHFYCFCNRENLSETQMLGLKSSNIEMHHTEASKAGGRPCVGLLWVLPLFGLSPERWHLVQLSLTGTWAAPLFSPWKNTLPLQANAVAMQGNRGGMTPRELSQRAQPHICKHEDVYLDFWVKRKEVLSSIISAQFVQLICFSSILGQRKALILLPGHTEANIHYLERVETIQKKYFSCSLCNTWDDARLLSCSHQHGAMTVKWCGSAEWENRQKTTTFWII